MSSGGPENQQAVIAFLSQPASYDLVDAPVERIASHCSIVFLAADRAYKLKRAIRYASLDYTTLADRRAACEAELALNRRTAPDLYLAVRTITRDDAGRLSFDGPGELLDYVVMMRRFAQSDLFDAMEQRDALTPTLMHELGASIARFHLAAEPRHDCGGSEAIGRVIADNERELALVAPELDGAAVDTLGERSRAMLTSLAPLLDRRRSAGKVRRCHGDLRLANICLFRGRPTMFDCIEFSEEIGCIDMLYDLAFVLMDLELLGRNDLANAVFNAHADVAPDPEGLRTLPLFLSLRAATRSYALAGKSGRQTDPAGAECLMLQARQHIAAGIDFLAPAPPRVIALGGEDEDSRRRLACHLAGQIAPVPGARVLRPESLGEAGWHEAGAVLASGCSVLLEAGFHDETARARAVALAAAHAAPFEALWTGPTPPGDGAWRPPTASRRAFETLPEEERRPR